MDSRLSLIENKVAILNILPSDILTLQASRLALYVNLHCPDGNSYSTKMDFKFVSTIFTYLLTVKKYFTYYEKCFSFHWKSTFSFQEIKILVFQSSISFSRHPLLEKKFRDK